MSFGGRAIIPYNPKLKELARKLRRQGNLSEVLLWQQVKGKQIMGFDFHRQKPVNNFIVDFFCPELMLAVEIDGSSHNAKQTEDQERQLILEGLGITVLRFNDDDVKHNLNGVILAIREWIEGKSGDPNKK